MAIFRQAGRQIGLLILSLASLAVSIYLTIVHYSSNVPLVCNTGGLINCERVLVSSYAYVPMTTLPVSLAGIVWSLVAGVLAIAWFPARRWSLLPLATVAWGGIGLLSVFYLVYAELVQIRAICAWCTVVHVLVLIYFLIALVLMQSPGTEEDEEDEQAEQTDDASLVSSHTS